jgi:hypothetical protein
MFNLINLPGLEFCVVIPGMFMACLCKFKSCLSFFFLKKDLVCKENLHAFEFLKLIHFQFS